MPIRFTVPLSDVVKMVKDIIEHSPDEDGVACARDILNNMQHLYYLKPKDNMSIMVWDFRDGEKVREQYKRLLNK